MNIMSNRREGKSYQQFVDFINTVKGGKEPIMIGKEYVVISHNKYQALIHNSLSVAQKTDTQHANTAIATVRNMSGLLPENKVGEFESCLNIISQQR